MNGWLDWREIEEQNDWGLREKSDAMGQRWDDDAGKWDERWKSDLEFTKRQADALKLLRANDSVLDVCCGTGPLTVHVAPRVRKVVAFDYGEHMLELLRANCVQRGITNVETLQGNWYSMEPGVDLPICDVAITRWSPAHGDILKFSRCASRYCYSISSCDLAFVPGGFQEAGFWCRSTVDDALNHSPRPCGRKNGFNVHFNLLYDHGANPTIEYVMNESRTVAASKEELLRKVVGPPALVERDSRQLEDGTWMHYRKHVIAIMGWDPNEITY